MKWAIVLLSLRWAIVLLSLLLAPAAWAYTQVTLLANGAATGGFVWWPGGGDATLRCYGTWNSATITLEESPDGTTTFSAAIANVSLTSANPGVVGVPLVPSYYRVVVSGSPSAMNCWLRKSL